MSGTKPYLRTGAYLSTILTFLLISSGRFSFWRCVLVHVWFNNCLQHDKGTWWSALPYGVSNQSVYESIPQQDNYLQKNWKVQNLII